MGIPWIDVLPVQGKTVTLETSFRLVLDLP